MPHAESWPESLWWYEKKQGTEWSAFEPSARGQQVIDAYITRYAHGVAAVPDDFRQQLICWLHELKREQNLKQWRKPKTKRYWTIPDYARANGIQPHTLMKRLRELENVAKEMFPELAKHYGRRIEPVSETEKEDIIREYWKDMDIKAIAKKHGLNPGHVGRICADHKEMKRAVRRQTA